MTFKELIDRGITEEFLRVEWAKTEPSIEDIDLPIPQGYKDRETYRMELGKKYSVVAKWIKNCILAKLDYANIFLLGRTGSGKSYLGCLALKTLYSKGFKILRIPFSTLMENYFANSFSLPAYATDDLVLFIEDIGREVTNKMQHQESVLEYLLNYRKERKFYTILASSLGINEFQSKYGSTITSIINRSFIKLVLPEVDLGLAVMSRTARKLEFK